jgi:hypothetical protein
VKSSYDSPVAKLFETNNRVPVVFEMNEQKNHTHVTPMLSKSGHLGDKMTKYSIISIYFKIRFGNRRDMLIPYKFQELSILCIFDNKIEVKRLHQKLQQFGYLQFLIKKNDFSKIDQIYHNFKLF